MANSTSIKGLGMALDAFLREPTLPIPEQVNEIVTLYVAKHGNEKVEESAADRLNEELAAVFEKRVRDHPEKHVAFLVLLFQLRPILRTTARLLPWAEKLLDPIVEYSTQEKGISQKTLTDLADLITIDKPGAEETGLAIIARRFMSKWIEIVSDISAEKVATRDFKQVLLLKSLVVLGKKEPKVFMNMVNEYVLNKEHRNSALHLLCDYIQSQPPHLYVVLQTPLFSSLLQSLQKDTSTTTVALALVALMMLMPCISSSLVPFLPTLFNVYARLLFWDKDRNFGPEYSDFVVEIPDANNDAWEKSAFDPHHDGISISHLADYFTFLYGLYPINFMDYIRKPQRYLRHANNAEDIDVQATEIRDRSEKFRQQHLLHPNFYSLTIETEKTDFNRWVRSEADEILTECMALSLADRMLPKVEFALAPGRGRSEPASSIVEERLTGALAPSFPRDTGVSALKVACSGPEPSERGEDGWHDRPESAIPHVLRLSSSSSPPQLQDMIQSNKNIKSTLYHSLANDSVPSLALSSRTEQSNVQAAPSREMGTSPSVALLQVQVAQLSQKKLLLENDLQFERYVKQQHITHIGEMRRKQVRLATTEAETQNLVMGNKNLRQRLDEAKNGELRTKREADNRRNMAKKLETDLSAKLKTLREEQKKWGAATATLQRKLDEARAENEGLRRELDAAESAKLKAEQNLEAVDINTNEIERLRSELTRLSLSECRLQGTELRAKAAIQGGAEAERRVEALSLDLAARNRELHKMRHLYESQIAELNARLAETATSDQEQKEVVSAVYEEALETARSKHVELQKQHSALMRKYTVLHSSFLDMQCDAEEQRAKEYAASSLGTDSDVPGSSPGTFPRTMSPRSRPVPVPSATSPTRSSPNLEEQDSPKAGSSAERCFGRGGAQNAKDAKNKNDGKGEKNKRSMSLSNSLRGIRGFAQ